MVDEPLYVTFEFRGNLAEEVDRVKLGIAGLRNESARTYQRLIADSDEAFASMSKGNQRLAVSIQEDINSLRQLDAANKALDEGFARGTVTTLQYAEGKAKLAIQETDLRTGIQETSRYSRSPSSGNGWPRGASNPSTPPSGRWRRRGARCPPPNGNRPPDRSCKKKYDP